MLCAGLVNAFLLIAGIILRKALVFRPAIGMLILLPAVTMIIAGVVCGMTGESAALSVGARGAVGVFLDYLSCTPWPWINSVLNFLVFGHNLWIVALIGLVSCGIYALVEIHVNRLTYGD